LDSKEHKNPAIEDNAAPVSQADYLRGLAEIVKEEKLSELEVETTGVRITLKAPEVVTTVAAPLPAAYAVGAPVQYAEAAPEAVAVPAATAAPEEDLAEIVSPMVGVFYRAPSPNDPNFVEIGDKIEIGQTVALVEAMKVFNEITAEVAGTIVEIKPQTSDLVETGQVLVTVRP